MREALVSIFGQEGAVVVQYIITFVVILALVGVAVWMGRRYAGSSVNVAGRGRLPRLAVIDALTVDKRRRLVLVRRDNVEHLLLIGGPSDIVVEPSITRTRVAQRPGQTAPNHPQALPATNAPQPAPPPPPAPPAQRTAAQAALRARAMRPPAAEPPAPPEEPIPFPPRRLQPRQTERQPVREEPPNVAAPEPTTPATRPAAQARSEPIPETPRSATVPPARDAQSLRPKAKRPRASRPAGCPGIPSGRAAGAG